MIHGRRAFLLAVLPAALGAAALAAQQPISPERKNQQPRPPSFPGEPGEGMAKIDPKRLLKQNQREIQSDVERLFKLAQELKDQVATTDSSEVLSLPLLKKAEEIEKLAKQIKNLARSS